MGLVVGVDQRAVDLEGHGEVLRTDRPGDGPDVDRLGFGFEQRDLERLGPGVLDRQHRGPVQPRSRIVVLAASRRNQQRGGRNETDGSISFHGRVRFGFYLFLAGSLMSSITGRWSEAFVTSPDLNQRRICEPTTSHFGVPLELHDVVDAFRGIVRREGPESGDGQDLPVFLEQFARLRRGCGVHVAAQENGLPGVAVTFLHRFGDQLHLSQLRLGRDMVEVRGADHVILHLHDDQYARLGAHALGQGHRKLIHGLLAGRHALAVFASVVGGMAAPYSKSQLPIRDAKCLSW